MNLSKSRLENLALVAITPLIVVALSVFLNSLQLSVHDTPKQCKVYHTAAPAALRCQPMEEPS